MASERGLELERGLGRVPVVTEEQMVVNQDELYVRGNWMDPLQENVAVAVVVVAAAAVVENYRPLEDVVGTYFRRSEVGNQRNIADLEEEKNLAVV